MMRAPSFWWREPGPAAKFLRPAAAVYGAVAARRLDQAGERAGIPVVCIGNPTVGGAGKTPAAIATAHLLAAAGEQPVFLTRGYGGRLAGPLLVDAASHLSQDVGDEPLLLARSYPTVLARDRVAGARAARDAGASVVVMDDGFQNPSLVKDVSVLVIDAARGIGNGLVFPAGPLRAPLAPQLRCAQVVLVIGSNGAAQSVVRAAALPVFTGRFEPARDAVKALRSKPVLAFAGIADPDKFFQTLTAAEIDVHVSRSFPDHHRFTGDEAAGLIREAKGQGLTLATTEKDFVRLQNDPAFAELREHTRTLPITLIFDDPEGYRQLILSRVKERA